MGPSSWGESSQVLGRKFSAPVSVRMHDGRLVPAVTYVLAAGEKAEPLRSLWLDFPEHAALFPAIGLADGVLLLRYPALVGDAVARFDKDLARFGAQLASLYRTLRDALTEAELGHLADPFYKVDAADQLRVGFRPVERAPAALPPEAQKTWPRCDERALVYLIGTLVGDRIFTPRSALAKVINRCREDKPARRYQSLDELERAFAKLAAPPSISAEALREWRRVEEGIGWLELGHPERTIEALALVRDDGPYGRLARNARSLARKALVDRAAAARPEIPATAYLPSTAWVDAEPEAVRREASGDCAGALQLLSTVVVDASNQLAVFTSRSRLHLALGQLDRAIDWARRAIAADSSQPRARVLLVKALLAGGAFREALDEIDALLRLAPEDGTHHYLRGKVLLALGRHEESRAAFDRAAAMKPTLLEALLLRGELDRRGAANRKQVGTQQMSITLELPASLAELREVLLGGRTDDAIAALAEARFSEDLDAQLLLARLYAFQRQLDRATAIYDRVVRAAEPHRSRALVGKADILLDLGTVDAALAIFEEVLAARPEDIDAIEGRARALEGLGRVTEAAVEYRRFVALATARSDVRVRYSMS